MDKVITRMTKGIEHIATVNKYFYKTVALYYKNIVKKEIELAKISSHDKILCIGGGPCPISGILLHKYTGADVTIVDNDDVCVRCSRNVIKNLGYGDYISVLHNDGEEVCPKEYSVIHMAAQVSPMARVFNNLQKKCMAGSKILVRLPKKSIFGLYGDGDEEFLRNCKEKIPHFGLKNVESTALYIKTGGENEKSWNTFGKRNFHSSAAAV